MDSGEYSERINRVTTYISTHLAEPFTLSGLAKLACLSTFHFARLFKAYSGETVLGFVRRLRLEKAAYFLLYNPRCQVSRISIECGFSTQQNFAKAFKAHFGLSPSRFRTRYKSLPMAEHSNPGNMLRTGTHAQLSKVTYTEPLGRVYLEELPMMELAIIRSIGHYQAAGIEKALNRLRSWAEFKGLLSKGNPLFGIFWDNSATTPDDKCRYDACIRMTQAVSVGRPFETQVFQGGTYAFGNFEIADGDFYGPWNWFLRKWLPESGYELDDRPCLERYPVLDEGAEAMRIEIGLPLIVN